MKFTYLVGALALGTESAMASTGSYTVSGLGSRKQQITNAGGTTLDLAIAMMETYIPFCLLSTTTNTAQRRHANDLRLRRQQYAPQPANSPPQSCTPQGKALIAPTESQDGANFGIFKANWYMIRNACSQFSGQTAAQYNNGAALNSDLNADISCRHASQSYYGYDKWFAGHRNGQSGLSVGSPWRFLLTWWVVVWRFANGG